MSIFSIAVDTLFNDRNLGLDALWRAGGSGDGVPVRVIRSAPDDVVEWRESRARTRTVFIDVRVSQVPNLAKDDTFEIGGVVFAVTGAPQRDSERLVWKSEAREQ